MIRIKAKDLSKGQKDLRTIYGLSATEANYVRHYLMDNGLTFGNQDIQVEIPEFLNGGDAVVVPDAVQVLPALPSQHAVKAYPGRDSIRYRRTNGAEELEVNSSNERLVNMMGHVEFAGECFHATREGVELIKSLKGLFS